MRRIHVAKLSELVGIHMAELISRGELGGAEVIVNQDGETLFRRAYGTNGLHGGKLEPGMLYRIASMTKPITSVALLQQVDNGNVNLLAPVSEYLPGFTHMTVGHEENGRVVVDRAAVGVIRVFNLLSHTSGIGSAPLSLIQPFPRESVAATATYYSKAPLCFDPYTAESYSATAAFDVAARIVEVVSGEEFGAYLKRRVFDPLQMRDTGFDPSPEQWARTVAMHNVTDKGEVFDLEMTPGCVFEGIPPKACCAGGGLLSSAEDYSRFAEMLLDHGVSKTGARVLSDEMVVRMQTPHVPESMRNLDDDRWGLGVRVCTRISKKQPLPLGAFGWSGAYGTHFWVDPVNRITAVYMKNSYYDGGCFSQSGSLFERDVMDSLE